MSWQVSIVVDELTVLVFVIAGELQCPSLSMSWQCPSLSVSSQVAIVGSDLAVAVVVS